MSTRDVRKRFIGKKIHRGSQVIFGERQKLSEVLHSVQKAQRLPRERKVKETRQLKALIAATGGETA